MRRTLIGLGFPAEMLDVVHQAMPEDQAIWDAVGRDRRPGRGSGPLTVGFVGSAYPHKGPQLLVEAAQLVDCDLRVRIHGEVPRTFAERLQALDQRGVVELAGAFSHSELPAILAGLDAAVIPSLWWDCAPLVVAECLAGRLPVVAAEHGRHPRLRRARPQRAAVRRALGARTRGRARAARARARPARAAAGRHRGPEAVRGVRRRARGDLRRRSRGAGADARARPSPSAGSETSRRRRASRRSIARWGSACAPGTSRSPWSAAPRTDRSAMRRRRMRPRWRCATSGRPTSRGPRREGSR